VRLITGRRSKYAVLLLFAGALASRSGKLSEVTSSALAATLPVAAVAVLSSMQRSNDAEHSSQVP
jgi:hypothetical protein